MTPLPIPPPVSVTQAITGLDQMVSYLRSLGEGGTRVAEPAQSCRDDAARSPDSGWFRYYASESITIAVNGASWVLPPDSDFAPMTVNLRRRIRAMRPSAELDADLAQWQAQHQIEPDLSLGEGEPPGPPIP